ncbi:MAG: ATP-binding protein [Actinomycetota bacterium]|nr:ATP-binding protein [Actinomycetota bacterium]
MSFFRTALFAVLLLVFSLAAATFAAASVFGVPGGDLRSVSLLLVEVGAVGTVLALLLTRLGRFGGVRGQILGTALVGSLLLAGMVLAGARAMFISAHDLSILLTMLLFAALLATGFALLGAAPLAKRIERVREGTEKLAGGNLETELPTDGHDELSRLAEDFNHMARRLEEASSRERELERSRRDLIAAVSHDLRTPLASAQALIEAVSDGVAEDPETVRRYLRSARGEISHLSRLVDDLFELSRIDSGSLELTLEEASLRDLISDTLAAFQPEARKRGVSLDGAFADGIDPVLMNPPRLQRVFQNLLSNALRHTPPDGSILIRAELHGDAVRIEVSDTGEGISSEDLPRVFERSFRGEKSRVRPSSDSGAGLGLAIARGLIEAHGGSISAESREGSGSNFRFTLRRA